ncbi:MAG: glycosyltransferase family 4 protein [Candidatus Sumerlaeota bacterium]
MRILFLCSEYPPDRAGGIGVFTQQLARGMVRLGHQVFVLGVSVTLRESDDCGVHVQMISDRQVAGPHADFLARQWFLSRAARTLIEKEKIDLVEAPDYRGQAAFLNTPSRLTVPLVVRYHGTTTVFSSAKGLKSSRLLTFMETRGLAAATHRVAVSQFIADATLREFPGVPPVDEVIPNFTDAQAFTPDETVSRDPNLLLFLGKISLTKGVKELFAALPNLLERFQTLRLELAAGDTLDGSGRTSLREELLRELAPQYHSRVNFLGPVPHEMTLELYRRAGVCVFPSRMEALAIAPLEAMGCGCPVVVNGGSSLREQVVDGVTGLLADARLPQDLAEKIGNLLADRALAERLGAAARREVLEKFDLPIALARNEQFYQRCLTAGRDSLFR